MSDGAQRCPPRRFGRGGIHAGIALSCLAFLLPAGLQAGEVQLRMRFDPGVELTYSFTSTLRQETSTSQADLVHEMTLVGTTRQVVVEFDSARNTALIGQLGKGRWSMTEGADRVPVGSRDQTWCSAWRVDRRGRAVRRTGRAGDASRGLLLRTAGQIGESPQICAGFPDGEVSEGSCWKGNVLLPLLGMRLPGTGESAVSNLTTEAGTRCCVIRSRVSSGSSMAHTDWVPDEWLPDTRVTGVTRGNFDIDRGIWRSIGMDLHARLEGRDYEGRIHIHSALELESDRSLPLVEADGWNARVKAFDAVLGELCRSGGEAPVQRLEKLAESADDADWRRGLELTLALVRKTIEDAAAQADGDSAEERQQMPAQTAGAKTAELYKQATALAAKGQFVEAVRAYDRFLERAGGDTPGWMRILARYRMGLALVKLDRTEQALTAYRAIQAMEANDDYSLKLRKKAGEKAHALAGR